ncbi:uncharacterized protein LOC134236388 [Saccostrea cucullata]|uniref:uncharacterized protein LOC134236388 n=1 Tax=Saccostrea cuccullata TaxID=36930 RepID=UPI002ED44C6E
MDTASQSSAVSLETIHSLLMQMNSKLSIIEKNNVALEKRLTEIEMKMSDIKTINDSVSTLKSKVCTIENDLSAMKQTVFDVEQSAAATGQIFDDVKKTAENELKLLKHEAKTMRDNINKELSSMTRQNEELQRSVTDLKSRSMRDNLIFSGIPETPNEDCEAVVHQFLVNKLKIRDYISFERVHRMGKPDEFRTRPRNIVAKFSFYKDREFVRRRAPQKLKHTQIWINEQFPPEIEEKRKKLYPVMREARLNDRRVKLVVDKLYIDGSLYVPNENNEETLGAEGGANQGAEMSSEAHRGRPVPNRSRRGSGRRPAVKRFRRGSTPTH